MGRAIGYLIEIAVRKYAIAGDVGDRCIALSQSVKDRDLPGTMDRPIRIGRKTDNMRLSRRHGALEPGFKNGGADNAWDAPKGGQIRRENSGRQAWTQRHFTAPQRFLFY